jgi:hypothetical protein
MGLWRTKTPTWKASLCGLVGGAAGTLVMEGYWKALNALTGYDPKQTKPNPKNAPKSADLSLVGHPMREGEDSTQTVGRIAYESVAGNPPRSPKIRKALGPSVHWTYGTVQGGVYGAARHAALRRSVDVPDILGGGAAFGTALWGISVLVLPLLGLGKGPNAYPAKKHAAEWGAHVVYGLTAAAVTQALARLT